jgi:hypothetical protein
MRRPRNEVRATADDVARWLLGEVRLEGPLDPLEAADIDHAQEVSQFRGEN